MDEVEALARKTLDLATATRLLLSHLHGGMAAEKAATLRTRAAIKASRLSVASAPAGIR